MSGILLKPDLYFSYGQFLVYDQVVDNPGCLWTESHYMQGFARRASAASFRTLLEFGHAKVTFYTNNFFPKDSYERVVSVPFCVVSGKIIVDGPEEYRIPRFLELPAADYNLVAAQQAINDDEELIDLFFEVLEQPALQSAVLLADNELTIPDRLIEEADPA